MKYNIILLLAAVLFSCGYSSNDKKILQTVITEKNYHIIGLSFESEDLKSAYNQTQSDVYNYFFKICEKEHGNKNIDLIEKCTIDKSIGEVKGIAVQEFISKY